MAKDWRNLDAETKFAYLANQFVDSDIFSQASGISRKTIKIIFNTLQAGKNSKVLYRPEVQAGLRKARHKMTDATRRAKDRARHRKYETPLVKTQYGISEPFRTERYYPEYKKVLTSLWVTFQVENLPEAEIFRIMRERYELYLTTEQYNTFRFEYLVDAAAYLETTVDPGTMRKSPKRFFKDESLYYQAIEHDYIRLSTRPLAFDHYRGDPDYFYDAVKAEWDELKVRGAVRILSLHYTKYDDVEKVMPLVRKDYVKYKTKMKKQKNGKNKRGKGI